MNTVRFFFPHDSYCHMTYTKDNVVVPYIGELVFIEEESQNYIVRHIIHGYDEEGNDMADVYLDYPEEDYFDYEYWENPNDLDWNDYMDNLADDCNCPECSTKRNEPVEPEENNKADTKDEVDEYLSIIRNVFNKLGFDIEIHEIEV